MKVNRKILRSALIITVASLAIVAGGSTAFFSDTETSTDNVLQAGAIDLRIDNNSYYNGERSTETSWRLADLTDQLFFNFYDLKPGDWGEDTISAHITNNDAWLCMDITVTDTPDNGLTEPESEVDDTPEVGELQNYLKFVFWADDGDNVLEEDEVEGIIANNVPLSEIGTVALADSEYNIWSQEPNDPLEGGERNEPVYYVGKAWCFGDLTLNPVAPGDNSPLDDPGILCDGRTAGNESQTDAVWADVSFTAVQARHNGSYKCVGCEVSGDGWASSVYDSTQGLRKNGTAVPVGRSDPTEALGAPDGVFYSLGYGGELVVTFPGYITGNVTAVEVTFGRAGYPEELADVSVSEDGSNWCDVGTASNKDTNGISTFDVSGCGLSDIGYVRLVDASDPDLHNTTSDGYDLDAVGAVICLDELENNVRFQTDID